MPLDSNTIITTIASLVSAVIGGCLALLGNFLATRSQINTKAKENQLIASRFIEAILIEIDSIYSRYQELSHIIETSNTFLEYTMYINEDYFPVYHNNNGYLGLIEDKILREDIIQFYTQAKGFIDTIRTNNSLLEQLNNSTLNSRELSNIEIPLKGYLPKIKQDNKKVKNLYLKLQESIKNTKNHL